MKREQARALLLAYFGRVAKYGRDRRQDHGRIGGAHHGTGLPESTADLAGRATAPSGPHLAMEVVLSISDFAAAALKRERLTSEGQKELVMLKTLAPEQWTPAEVEAHAYLTGELAMEAARCREEWGWFRFDGIEQKILEDCPDLAQVFGTRRNEGLPRNVSLTFKGLKAAQDFLREHPEWDENKPMSADLGQLELAGAPSWAKSDGLL